MTWLYGPYKRSPRGLIEKVYFPLSKARPASINPPSTNSSPIKTILKASGFKDTITEDVVLLRSLSAGSLANRPASVVQWHKGSKVQHAPCSKYTDLSISIPNHDGISETKSPRKKRVRFDFQVGKFDDLAEGDDGELSRRLSNLIPEEEELHATNRHNNEAMSYSNSGSLEQSLEFFPASESNTDHSMVFYSEPSCAGGRLRSPPPEFILHKRKQKSKFFFLDDSEDEEFGVSDIEEENENEDTDTTDSNTSQNIGISGNIMASLSLLNKPPSLPEISYDDEIVDKQTASTTEQNPYWSLFRSAISKLQSSSLGSLGYKRPPGEKILQGIESSIADSGSHSDQGFSKSFDLTSRSEPLQQQNSMPVHAIGRLLSFHTQITGNTEPFQFGSVPPNISAEKEEEEEFFFGDMGDLDFSGTDADLAQLILHNRSMDWSLFKTEAPTKFEHDSTDANILPPLTPTRPPRDNISPRTSKSSQSIASSTMTKPDQLGNELDIATFCEAKACESKASSAINYHEKFYQKSNTKKLTSHKIGQWLPLEDLNLQDGPQAIEQLASTQLTDTTSNIGLSGNEFESMTESYGDDSVESTDSESLYGKLYETELSSTTKVECLGSALNPMQQALVNKIMGEFWTIFNQTWSSGLRQCTAQPRGSTNPPQSGGSALPNSSSSPSGSRKRQRREDELPDSGNGKKIGGTDDGMDATRSVDEVIRFACPFRKHEPHLYNVYDHSVCALSSWTSIARVK